MLLCCDKVPEYLSGACVSAYARARVYVCLSVCVCVCVCGRVPEFVRECLFARVCVCVCTYTNAHTHTYDIYIYMSRGDVKRNYFCPMLFPCGSDFGVTPGRF